LKKLALSYQWETGGGLWCFAYKDLKKVEALLNQKVEIENVREIFDKEKVIPPKWKGEDMVEIRTFPKIYQVIEHRKQEDGSVKELKNEIPKATVEKIWKDVLVHQPLNKKIKTRTVAEKICNAFGIIRFNREESNTFSWEKFFGARTYYMKYFWMPVKILVHEKKVIHHKAGFVERII